MSDFDTRKGNIVIGVMLVLLGVGLVLQRTGMVDWSAQWSLWPFILGGIGLARFVASRPGEPKQGLLFMTAAAWLFAGDAGWVTLAESWPILVIVIGLIIALNGGRRWRPPVPPVPPMPPLDREARRAARRERHQGVLTPLAVVGIWIAIVVALQVSGVRSFSDTSSSDRINVTSVMGRGEHVSNAAAFRGADVTNIMGRSDIDLRSATIEPGSSATLQVLSTMGAVVVRVPPTWTVDTGAIAALGAVRDERLRPSEPAETTGQPAPRLVIRGVVMFGRLAIR